MSGTFVDVIQYRIDSEPMLSGQNGNGVYNVSQKISVQLVTTGAVSPQVTYTPGTPVTIDWNPVTIANMQSYFFMVDQGTLANPIIAHWTCSTGGIYVPLQANVPFWWDITQLAYTNSGVSTLAIPTGGAFNGSEAAGTYTSSGSQITGLTLNVPSALGLASPGTVNLIGRVCSI